MQISPFSVALTDQFYNLIIIFSCALTLKPVETPVCTSDGTLFELLSIIPWLKEHGTNPVTGKPMVPGDLISVNFHFNSDGKFLLQEEILV